jgi:diguanylate cyclase (GGDEF)-like protein
VTIRGNALTPCYGYFALIPDLTEEESMRPGVGKRLRECARGARAWPVWELRRRVLIFVLAVVAAYAVAIGVASRTAALSVHGLIVLGALLLCIIATVGLTRRAGENAGLAADVYAVWELPIAILLPPVYALLIPIVRCGLNQCLVRPTALYKRVFSAAVVGLSYGAASLAFHGLTRTGFGSASAPGSHATVWILAVAAAAVVQWAVNTSLMMPAIKGGDPAIKVRELLLARENVQNDVAELCVAVLVVVGIAYTPLTVVFALPFVTLLQRSLRHAQLLNASRVDSKTGLLNAGTWEREAASEVARAVRTRTPLALMLIDLDHFKAVNDAYGHLAGDKALRAISRTFKIFLREYDLVGRFGGEEFALLLPQTGAADAQRIAERMRVHIAEMPIAASDDPEAELIRVKVSIGVAALGTAWGRATGSQLTDLLAAADAALYRAKAGGRDRVCMITDAGAAAPVAEKDRMPSSLPTRSPS